MQGKRMKNEWRRREKKGFLDSRYLSPLKLENNGDGVSRFHAYPDSNRSTRMERIVRTQSNSFWVLSNGPFPLPRVSNTLQTTSFDIARFRTCPRVRLPLVKLRWYVKMVTGIMASRGFTAKNVRKGGTFSDGLGWFDERGTQFS